LDTILEVTHLSKSYGSITAVEDTSLAVRRGEFLCIIGPSGCGKTTLLRAIAGFVDPSSGDILLDGKSILSLPPYQRPLNMVFQSYALFPHMTVGQNVGFGMEMHKVEKEERAERVRNVLSSVELAGFENRSVTELSGGQQQRVALARALVLNPRVLLLDEPLGALDQKVRRKMQLELKRLHRDVGITFIHVTHDQEEALAMADRIAVMSEGRIEQLDETMQVYSQPRTPFVASFVGESNHFSGSIEPGPLHKLSIQIGGGLWIGLPRAWREVAGSVQVFVRPEHIFIGPTNETGMNLFDGTIRDIIFLGETARFYVSLSDQVEIIVTAAADALRFGNLPASGTKVRVGWHIEASIVFPAREPA